jgi:hypothetical protein
MMTVASTAASNREIQATWQKDTVFAVFATFTPVFTAKCLFLYTKSQDSVPESQDFVPLSCDFAPPTRAFMAQPGVSVGRTKGGLPSPSGRGVERKVDANHPDGCGKPSVLTLSCLNF